MRDLAEIEGRVEALLAAPPYASPLQAHRSTLLSLLKDELAYASSRNAGLLNYFSNWPTDYRTAETIAELPYLPVGVFKEDPPLSLVEPRSWKRILLSSATTGQNPSRVVLDAATARRMTKGIVVIIRDFIGSARRPYLVVDSTDLLSPQAELGARGVAIQGLGSFATEVVCCLRTRGEGEPTLDMKTLLDFARKWRKTKVLVYGFTYILWEHLVKPLESAGICVDLPRAHVLHSGGWKRVEKEAVTKDVFTRRVSETIGCPATQVIDFYGMVENVGVVYPDCEVGNKHVPAFAEVIVRDPLTLKPVDAGHQGLLQLCSVLPTSFPGFLLLSEDIAEVVDYQVCPCGRLGTCFRFIKRAPRVELRGCGNIVIGRHEAGVQDAYGL